MVDDLSHFSPLCREIHTQLYSTLAPTVLSVEDESSLHAGHQGVKDTHAITTHVKVTIQAPTFQGHSRLQCHRIINDTLRFAFEKGLHALSIKIV